MNNILYVFSNIYSKSNEEFGGSVIDKVSTSSKLNKVSLFCLNPIPLFLVERYENKTEKKLKIAIKNVNKY